MPPVTFPKNFSWIIGAGLKLDIGRCVKDFYSNRLHCLFGCATDSNINFSFFHLRKNAPRNPRFQHLVPKQWGYQAPICPSCYERFHGVPFFIRTDNFSTTDYPLDITVLEKFFYFLPTYTSTSFDITDVTRAEWKWQKLDVMNLLLDLKDDFGYHLFETSDEVVFRRYSVNNRGPKKVMQVSSKQLKRDQIPAQGQIFRVAALWEPVPTARTFPLYQIFKETIKHHNIIIIPAKGNNDDPNVPEKDSFTKVNSYEQIFAVGQVYPLWVHYFINFYN